MAKVISKLPIRWTTSEITVGTRGDYAVLTAAGDVAVSGSSMNSGG